MTDRPQTSELQWNGHHQHAWRCLSDEESSAGELVLQCTICHPSRVGLRVGSNGTVRFASDVASQQQQASADDRERALDLRESRLRAWESRAVQLKDEVEDLIAKAAQRDEVADARDSATDERDMTANLDARLHRGPYRPDAQARQESAMDRAFLTGDGCILCGRDG